MPEIVDYQVVEETLRAKSLRCLYFNSGSWGFEGGFEGGGDGGGVRAVGWVLGDDSTMTAAAREVARVVGGVDEVVAGVLEGWRRVGGEVWVLPGSHWAYELDFGTPGMLEILRRAGVVGVEGLVGRTDGSAVRFSGGEEGRLAGVLGELFTCGTTSDYQLILLDLPAVAILHHHVQIWWQARDMAFCDWAGGVGKSL